jgi:hypothetical protein
MAVSGISHRTDSLRVPSLCPTMPAASPTTPPHSSVPTTHSCTRRVFKSYIVGHFELIAVHCRQEQGLHYRGPGQGHAREQVRVRARRLQGSESPARPCRYHAATSTRRPTFFYCWFIFIFCIFRSGVGSAGRQGRRRQLFVQVRVRRCSVQGSLFLLGSLRHDQRPTTHAHSYVIHRIRCRA